MQSRHSKMADILVPVSTALLNAYDEAYLGLGAATAAKKAKAPAAPRKAPAPKAQPAPADCSACGQEKGSDQCSSCATMNWELGAKPPAAAKPQAKPAKKGRSQEAQGIAHGKERSL